MDAPETRHLFERIAVATASPWSFGVWFGFTYLPPASLVGREAPM